MQRVGEGRDAQYSLILFLKEADVEVLCLVPHVVSISRILQEFGTAERADAHLLAVNAGFFHDIALGVGYGKFELEFEVHSAVCKAAVYGFEHLRKVAFLDVLDRVALLGVEYVEYDGDFVFCSVGGVFRFVAAGSIGTFGELNERFVVAGAREGCQCHEGA